MTSQTFFLQHPHNPMLTEEIIGSFADAEQAGQDFANRHGAHINVCLRMEDGSLWPDERVGDWGGFWPKK